MNADELVKSDEALIKEVKNRAALFCVDNLLFSQRDHVNIETAMMIGASIGLDWSCKND